MERMGMVIGLKSEHIDEYRRLHAEAWPEILAKISECNIANYSIYLKEPENLLFGYLGVRRRRLRGRRGEDGGRSDDPGVVENLHADAESLGNPKRRRMVGDDGRDIPS